MRPISHQNQQPYSTDVGCWKFKVINCLIVHTCYKLQMTVHTKWSPNSLNSPKLIKRKENCCTWGSSIKTPWPRPQTRTNLQGQGRGQDQGLKAQGQRPRTRLSRSRPGPRTASLSLRTTKDQGQGQHHWDFQIGVLGPKISGYAHGRTQIRKDQEHLNHVAMESCQGPRKFKGPNCP